MRNFLGLVLCFMIIIITPVFAGDDFGIDCDNSIEFTHDSDLISFEVPWVNDVVEYRWAFRNIFSKSEAEDAIYHESEYPYIDLEANELDLNEYTEKLRIWCGAYNRNGKLIKSDLITVRVKPYIYGFEYASLKDYIAIVLPELIDSYSEIISNIEEIELTCDEMTQILENDMKVLNDRNAASVLDSVQFVGAKIGEAVLPIQKIKYGKYIFNVSQFEKVFTEIAYVKNRIGDVIFLIEFDYKKSIRFANELENKLQDLEHKALEYIELRNSVQQAENRIREIENKH